MYNLTNVEEIFIYKKMLKIEEQPVYKFFYKNNEYLKLFTENFLSGLGVDQLNIIQYINFIKEIDFNKVYFKELIEEGLNNIELINENQYVFSYGKLICNII